MTYADRDRYGMYKDSDSAGPGPALMGADTLIGDSVVNSEDDNLGDIKEIMIDMRSGQVAYAVLAFGGFLGMGEKLFAVPWQALRLDTVNKRFVLDIDKDRLKDAPGFNPDAWPDMGDVNWALQIHTFYGTDPNQQGGSMGSGMPMGGMIGGTRSGAGAGMGAGMGGSSMGAGAAGSSGSSGSSGAAGGSSLGSGAGSSGLGGSVGGSSGLGTGSDVGTSTGSGLGSSSGSGSSAGSSADLDQSSTTVIKPGTPRGDI